MLKKKKKHLISFLGGIGAGKTTAMQLMAKNFGLSPIKEQHGKNSFLPLFYKDMKRWALNSQLFFLCEKFDQLLKIKEILKKTSVVLDVDISQDLCYLEAQKKLRYIDKNEYALYYKVYGCMKSSLPKPDLIIYLKSSAAILKEHIKERGRGYEKKISKSYLQALVNAQDQWIKRNKKSFHIITIDVEKIDFAHRSIDKKRFIDLVKKHL